ncbi:MAG: tetratricopeptide repeat protein [Alphaproteobacteria bacterium]|nr:tetratricopeptide repeat protein [Alphaproteobacteria bacterium]
MAAAAPPGLEALAEMEARMNTLAQLEALSEELESNELRDKSNAAVRQALLVWRSGDVAKAGQLALEATQIDDTNPRAFHILAAALERMGFVHKALVTYEKAFALDPDDPELLIDLGLAAWHMKMNDSAATMFKHYIAARPDSPLGYNNLGSLQGDMGDLPGAVETLRAAIFKMPYEAILWHSLATVLADAGRAEESLPFYREAIRLAPEVAQQHHNLGYACLHLGMMSEALECFGKALEGLNDPLERAEARHSRSICLIGMGQLEDGFAEYESRNDPLFRAYVPHMIASPEWNGEPLEGKRLLLVGEQGLGDELMFANTVPDLLRLVGREGKLQIAVDQRLMRLFQRSFPEAEVGISEDRVLHDKDGNKTLRFVPFAVRDGQPDFFILMGSTPKLLRRRIEDFRREAFLKPDAARVETFRAALARGPALPTVGLCWRSMMIDPKRAKYYSTLDMWEPILTTPGVRFVNLQYGDCAGELSQACARFGTTIETIDGLDLTRDVDGVAVLSAALDLVISAPTAAAATAGSVGTEVWFLCAGRTWPQLGTQEFPWYRKTRVFSPEKFGDWASLMPAIAKELAAFAGRPI